jgi:hypothetical protein
MARPSPTVLLDELDPSGLSFEVCAADAVYAVYYKRRPIKLRKRDLTQRYPGGKYNKVSFPEPGHAFNLAEKLNKKFNTTDFEVIRLSGGRFIQENLPDY